jgi:hypothetical protein
MKAMKNRSEHRQKLLILYLHDSALDSHVIGWSQYDGTGATDSMAGDSDEPPYKSGLHALKDGWRLFQMSQLQPHSPGDEFRTSYLKYEFAFEKWVEVDAQGRSDG